MSRAKSYSRQPLVHDLHVRRAMQPNKAVNNVLKELDKMRDARGLDDMKLKDGNRLGASLLHTYRLQRIMDRVKGGKALADIPTSDLARELEVALEYSVPHKLGSLAVDVTGLTRVGKRNRSLAVEFTSHNFEAEAAALDDYLAQRFGLVGLTRDSLPHITLATSGPRMDTLLSATDLSTLEARLPDTLVLHRPTSTIGYTQATRNSKTT